MRSNLDSILSWLWDCLPEPYDDGSLEPSTWKELLFSPLSGLIFIKSAARSWELWRYGVDNVNCGMHDTVNVDLLDCLLVTHRNTGLLELNICKELILTTARQQTKIAVDDGNEKVTETTIALAVHIARMKSVRSKH